MHFALLINIESQTKKLKVLKVWCQASIHYFKEKAKDSFTLGPVISFKLLLDRIKYPKNAIFARIESLSCEAKELNRKANKIFEKGIRSMEMDLSE